MALPALRHFTFLDEARACPVCGREELLAVCCWCGEQGCSEECWAAIHNNDRGDCPMRPPAPITNYDGPPDDDITW